jgi:anhydro-N-acetylmuramic acid kinase
MTQIIGLMSGTSKDGLDVAHVSFKHSDRGYSFKLLHGLTIAYPKDILDALDSIETLSASNVYQLDKQIGQFYGESINDFIQY